jgi:hypothetical protein
LEPERECSQGLELQAVRQIRVNEASILTF